MTIEYEVTSGQGDQTILKQLSDQAIADGVDAIIPIATTAAQIAALSAEETKTPVVYAASLRSRRPPSLTGIDYVTGTSDALNTDFIMDMMFAQNPSVAKVGLLYSLSEPNSAKPIADAKAYLDAKGIEYVEQTANTNDEVVAAASALIAAGVDAVFTPTDNVIMAAELAIYEDLAKNGIPHYTGADSFVRNGAYATCGVNYTDLGTQTADLAYTAMTEGMDGMEDYYLMDGGIITVNTDTCRPHRQAGRLRLLQQHGRGGRGQHHQGLIQSNSPHPLPRPAAGGSGMKGAHSLADDHTNRSGTGLFIRFGGHGPVSELPDLEHRRYDHRRLFCPWGGGLCHAGRRRDTRSWPFLPPCWRAAAPDSSQLFCRLSLGIPSILAGIVTNTGLYTVNLMAMGWKANQSLLGGSTIFTLLRDSGIGGDWYELLLAASVTVLAGVLLLAFLKTRHGPFHPGHRRQSRHGAGLVPESGVHRHGRTVRIQRSDSPFRGHGGPVSKDAWTSTPAPASWSSAWPASSSVKRF